MQYTADSWVASHRKVTIYRAPLYPALKGPSTSEWTSSSGNSPLRIWLECEFDRRVDIVQVSHGVISGIDLVRSMSSVVSAIRNTVLSATWPSRLCHTLSVSGLTSAESRASCYSGVVSRNQQPFLLVAVRTLCFVLIRQDCGEKSTVAPALNSWSTETRFTPPSGT
jgi:hypothetical protein